MQTLLKPCMLVALAFAIGSAFAADASSSGPAVTDANRAGVELEPGRLARRLALVCG